MTDQPPTLAAALAELQTQLPHIGKTATAQYGKYADLADVSREMLPLMGKLGLSFIARPTLNENGQFVLLWSLLHVSGDHESGQYPLPGMDKGPQALGSAITYARRYTLCAVTGVSADDDDDGAAAEDAPREAANGGRWMNRRPDAPPKALQDKRTPARTTGSEHEQLRTGTVEATPDDRPAKRARGQAPEGDPWLDQPPGTFGETPPEDRHGSIDGRQRSILMAHLGKLRRDERLGKLAGMAGREVESTNDLSWVEADRAIKAIEAEQKAAEQDAAAEATP